MWFDVCQLLIDSCLVKDCFGCSGVGGVYFCFSAVVVPTEFSASVTMVTGL